jgi:septum formation protein
LSGIPMDNPRQAGDAAHSPARPVDNAGKPPRLILASASPRRQELLREAGFDFIVHPANIDEDDNPPDVLPIELAALLSVRKARPVAEQFPGDVVLAADTVVAFGDRPLGKPDDADEAREMLALLSGTTHLVITGVTITCRQRGLEDTQTVMSAVRMRQLSPREIDAYVASGQWHGKAGGYGIQDKDPFVTNQAGSLSNIVGLPMEATTEMLARAGIAPQPGREVIGDQ